MYIPILSLGKRLDLKDVQVLFSFGLFFVCLPVSQQRFFPNVEMNFDPDIFIYVYGIFGVITWLVFKTKYKPRINQIMALFFLTRIGILAFQAICYVVGPYYNVTNEVAYYQYPLAAVLVDPDVFSPYQFAKYGMPPMFQFWLLGYNILIFSQTSVFFRDLLFSLFNVAFDFATITIMVKIFNSGGLKHFSVNEEQTRKENFEFGLFFYAVSIFHLYYNHVRNFMDVIPISLAIAGIYFYTKDQHARSALFLSISTLMKFIPIFWLLLIVLKYIKKKEFKTALTYVTIAASTAIIGFLSSAIYFQENPLYYFAEFFPQFYKWSRLSGDGIQLNQALWYENYTSTFFIIGLIAIVALSCFFVWKERDGPTIHAFTAITSLYFIFQPWYDQRYLLWILPLICMDLFSSKRNFMLVISLFYVSILIYLVFMHVPNNLKIDTLVTSPTRYVGDLYRVTGQFISYAGFGLTIFLFLKQALPTIGIKNRLNMQ